MNQPRVVAAGDGALLVEFEPRIDPDVNIRAVTLAAHLRAQHILGVYDVVPAFRTVTVYFDPLRTAVDVLTAAIHAHRPGAVDEDARHSVDVEIPVCYDLDFALDLPELAARSGLAIDDVVAMHTGPVYRVYMLGFMPGFAYLGRVDRRIAAPRREVPRTKVPAGSVGIAGEQTGVYPTTTPGGWNIVGRTPVRMLTLDAAAPSLLTPGQLVRFRAIDRATFDAWPAGQGQS